VVEFGRHARL